MGQMDTLLWKAVENTKRLRKTQLSKRVNNFVYMKYIDGVWVDSGKCTGSKLHHYEVEVVE
mgnify:CR=1 FL=1